VCLGGAQDIDPNGGDVTTGDMDLLGWINSYHAVANRRGRDADGVCDGVRFAFYGRTSTVDFQDQVTSWAWQREVSASVVAGRGVIVAEFFDAGYSRLLAWADRPQAAALLAAVADPDRRFEAIVVGEYERVLHGDQLHHLLPLLDRYGVQLWLPETHGPLDPTDPAHQALLLLLGAQSRREVVRARHRVLAAMHAQSSSRAGTWAGAHPTATTWSTPARIQTVHAPGGDGDCTGWIPTGSPRRRSGGSSPSG
jgi:site-specific DNA recombinase